MRRTILATALILLTGATAYADGLSNPAAGVKYRWRGAFKFTAVTAGCPVNVTGDHTTARFLPANLGANGARSGLAIFYSNYSLAFSVAGPFGTTFKPAQVTETAYLAGNYQASIRFLTQSPANIVAATNYIIATGQIQGYDATPTCTATFSVMLQKE